MHRRVISIRDWPVGPGGANRSRCGMSDKNAKLTKNAARAVKKLKAEVFEPLANVP